VSSTPRVDRPEDLAVTPDGSPVLLYRRVPPSDEPLVIDSAVQPGSAILELGAGAGRVTRALVDLGHRVVAVDQSAEMLRWVQGAETVVADIEGLELGRRFDAVVLGSHLVNTDDATTRAAFLATCRRHVADDGLVLIEHHPEDWAATASESRTEVEGVVLSLTEVRRAPPLVSATMIYEIDGQTFRQPFVARVFSAAELDSELDGAGLRLARRLTPTWVSAVPIAGDGRGV
jgi:SAM-dependent methyltransferase